MSIRDIYDSEIPLECYPCPKCKSTNWAEGPHPAIYQLTGAEAIRCWRCRFVFWGSDCHKETCLNDFEFAAVEDGFPDPMIPINVLETLTDAVAGQRDNLTMSIKKEHTEYDELVKELRHLEDCVDYMKRLLNEREAPSLALQSSAPF